MATMADLAPTLPQDIAVLLASALDSAREHFERDGYLAHVLLLASGETLRVVLIENTTPETKPGIHRFIAQQEQACDCCIDIAEAWDVIVPWPEFMEAQRTGKGIVPPDQHPARREVAAVTLYLKGRRAMLVCPILRPADARPRLGPEWELKFDNANPQLGACRMVLGPMAGPVTTN